MIELQKIRAQIIGFKITFVAAFIGLLGARLAEAGNLLFAIPGFAAVSFDLLVISYTFSIKRTGYYCRHYLEPVLRAPEEGAQDVVLWEQFMASPEAGANVSFLGTLGLTFLAVAVGLVAALRPGLTFWSVLVSLALLAATVWDVVAFQKPNVFSKRKRTRHT
jgi:hypothetical protein